MSKTVKALLSLIFFSLFITGQVSAAATSDINTLIKNSLASDKQVVVLEGEAIGEPMLRGEYAWINISDKTNAIGIWVKASDARKISVFGDYKHKGDVIRVTGLFSRNCPEHGGDIDIHSATLAIKEKGHAVPEEMSTLKITAALLFFFSASAAGLIYWRRIH
ncbi:MAG: DNA-binding protein [Acidaminococcaceae bacterium]